MMDKMIIETKITNENQYTNEVRPCDILLKEATAQKKIKNWDGAIRCLREAYIDIENYSTQYSIETFLRLPMYLHEAGRKQEAFQEFQKLLARAQKKQLNIQAYFDIHTITDKMRLCFQRDGLFSESAKFGVISYLYRAYALNLQLADEALRPYISRTLAEYTSPIVVANHVENLMKKVDARGQTTILCAEIQSRLHNLSREIHYNQLSLWLDDIFGLKS